MSASALTLMFGAAVLHGIALIIAILSLNGRDQLAQRLLAGILGVFTLILTEEFLDLLGWPWTLGVGVFAIMLIGPLIYLLMRRVSEHAFELERGHLWHFVPFGFAVLLWVYLQVTLWGQHWSMNNENYRAISLTWGNVKTVYFYAYLGVTLFRLVQARPRSGERRKTVGLLRIGLIVFGSVLSLEVVSFWLFAANIPWIPDSDLVSGIILSGMIYGLGYLAFIRPDLLEQRTPTRAIKKSADLSARLAEVLTTVRAAGSYLQPDADVDTLVKPLGMPRDDIEALLNQAYPGGCTEFLNALRLDHFKRAVKADDQQEYSILQLAFDAGFSSKASFYRAFRAAEGITPSQYRKSL